MSAFERVYSTGPGRAESNSSVQGHLLVALGVLREGGLVVEDFIKLVGIVLRHWQSWW